MDGVDCVRWVFPEAAGIEVYVKCTGFARMERCGRD